METTENPESEPAGRDEELIEIIEDPSGAQELRGKRIITLLTVIVAAANILVAALPGEGTSALNFIGIVLSILVMAGIILLGLWWKSKPSPPPNPVVNVSSIASSVGTPCKPNQSKRIAREAGTPAFTAWTVVSTFTQKSLVAGAKKFVPSAKFLTYGFVRVTRTMNYTCQQQVCNNGAWANSGPGYTCNTTVTRTFQVYGGPPPSAPLQAWTDRAIKQSFSSGYY